jgi:hypothetical protein
LLCQRRERPCGCAAEKSDKFASPHGSPQAEDRTLPHRRMRAVWCITANLAADDRDGSFATDLPCGCLGSSPASDVDQFLLSAPAHASGWQSYYDCGDGVVSKFGGYHGTSWVIVEDDHTKIYEEGEPGGAFMTDNADLSFRVKWRGTTKVLRYQGIDNPDSVQGTVSFGGHACRPMGNSGGDTGDEVWRYEQDKEKK